MVTPPAQASVARRVALCAAVCELAIRELMERRLGFAAGPYKHGPAARFSHVGRLCIAAGAKLLCRRGGRSRPAAVAGGALLNAGALSVRWSVFKAGHASAMDPKYVVRPQREALQGRERAAPPSTRNGHV